MSAPEAVATTTPPVEAQPVEPIPAPTAEIPKDEEPVAVATVSHCSLRPGALI